MHLTSIGATASRNADRNEVADLSTLPKDAKLFVRGNVIYVRMPGELGLSVIVR